MKICSYCGITEAQDKIIHYNNNYYCKKHYLQMFRKGHCFKTIYEPNVWILYKNKAECIIYECIGNTETNKEIGRIIFDIEDVERLRKNRFKIRKQGTKYYGKSKHQNASYLVLNIDVKDGYVIDHINGNGLDNRKENLRQITRKQNSYNINKTMKQTGVSRSNRQNKPWKACLMHNGKNYSKRFSTYEEAVNYRCYLEKKYFKFD